jgi:Mrp family chromosome partitioning ATPase
VIIDAPPLLPVTDAAVLAHNADGAMIVASVGKTTVETLQRAIQNLDRAGARCLGVVINRVPVRGRGKGYDDYRYAGDYYTSTTASASVPVELAPRAPRAGRSPEAAPVPESVVGAGAAERPASRRARRENRSST